MSNIKIELSEDELNSAISSLLFSCSVNVVSNTNMEFQSKLLELAKKLKQHNPNTKLTDVQFVKEEEYEDGLSVDLFNNFKDNIEVITFDHI